MNSNELMTVWMAAQEKDVHPKSVYRAIYDKRLVAEKIGKTVMIRRGVLEGWSPRRARKPSV